VRKILAPHKEQRGWVYVRVPSGYARPDMPESVNIVTRPPGLAIGIDSRTFKSKPELHVAYNDTPSTQRIISSRRVEEAVETADYLKRCADEGLRVQREFDEWVVCRVERTPGTPVQYIRGTGVGATLREAYFRYHAAIEKETA
jgi:hypothetical protein